METYVSRFLVHVHVDGPSMLVQKGFASCLSNLTLFKTG